MGQFVPVHIRYKVKALTRQHKVLQRQQRHLRPQI